MLIELFAVGTRMIVVTLGPSLGYKLDKILISFLILCQHNEVITLVLGVGLIVEVALGYIHLAAEDGLQILSLFLGESGLSLVDGLLIAACCGFVEGGLSLFYAILDLAVMLLYSIEKLFGTEHVAMVGEGKGRHTVGDSLLDKAADCRQTVENRVLRMDVKMYELVHSAINEEIVKASFKKRRKSPQSYKKIAI